MKKIYTLGASFGLLLFILALWKNSKSYSLKPRSWRIYKSITDTSIVILSALYMPAILVGLTVGWLVRPITRKGIQTVLGILCGLAVGVVSGFALELICITGIFAVDLLTGKAGFYGWWSDAIPEQFMHDWISSKELYDT